MDASQRVLHGQTDISVVVNDFRTGSYVFAYAGGSDALYVACEVPFTNLFFDVSSPNALAAQVGVDVWWGNSWHAAVDVIDETRPHGGPASLAQSGRLSWRVDRLRGWDRIEDPSTSSDQVVKATKIYDLYWSRLKWSAALSSTTAVAYIGQKFSSDEMLYSYYPDLRQTSLKSSFASGKTSWNEQHYMAAEVICRDLISREIVRHRGQVFDARIFGEASCHKVAEIVYRGIGQSYEPARVAARKAYDEAMHLKVFRVDDDADGKTSPKDLRSSSTYQKR